MTLLKTIDWTPLAGATKPCQYDHPGYSCRPEYFFGPETRLACRFRTCATCQEGDVLRLQRDHDCQGRHWVANTDGWVWISEGQELGLYARTEADHFFHLCGAVEAAGGTLLELKP